MSMLHGTVTIDDGYSKPRKLAADRVLVVGTDEQLPRELLAMRDCLRILEAIEPEEARRAAAWLAEKFPRVEIVEVK